MRIASVVGLCHVKNVLVFLYFSCKLVAIAYDFGRKLFKPLICGCLLVKTIIKKMNLTDGELSCSGIDIELMYCRTMNARCFEADILGCTGIGYNEEKRS